jgi:hypothetical protein
MKTNTKLLFITLLGIILFSSSLNSCIEGFGPSFSDCRSQGFSKEFCVQTPTSAVGPAGCRCEDGRLGMRMPGFRGECICDDRIF